MNDAETAMPLLPDGKIVGGLFTTVNGETRLRIARLHSDGSLDLGSTPDTPTRFYSVTPCRLFDTRESTGSSAAWPALGSGETRTLTVGTRCGLTSSTIRSLSVNQTVTAQTADGELVLYRADMSSPPNTSNLSFRAGKTRANNGILELSRNGDGAFNVHNRSTGSVHFILDVNGLFQ